MYINFILQQKIIKKTSVKIKKCLTNKKKRCKIK